MDIEADLMVYRVFYSVVFLFISAMSHGESIDVKVSTSLSASTSHSLANSLEQRIKDTSQLVRQYPVVGAQHINSMLRQHHELTDHQRLHLGLLKTHTQLIFNQHDKANAYLDKKLLTKLPISLRNQAMYLKALSAALTLDGQSALGYLEKLAVQSSADPAHLFEIDRLILLARAYLLLEEHEMASSVLHSARRLAITSQLNEPFCKVTLAQAQAGVLRDSQSLVTQHLSLFNDRCTVKELSIEQARLLVTSAFITQERPKDELALLIAAHNIYKTQQITGQSIKLRLLITKRYLALAMLDKAQQQLAYFDSDFLTFFSSEQTAQYYQLKAQLADLHGDNKAALSLYKQFARTNELITKQRLTNQSNYLTHRLTNKRALLEQDINKIYEQILQLDNKTHRLKWGSITLALSLFFMCSLMAYRYFGSKNKARTRSSHV